MRVYKPKKARKGRIKKPQFYTGFYRMPWDQFERSIALKTADKTVALKRLKEHCKRLELEEEGLPVPEGLWGAPSRCVLDLLAEYVNSLKSKGRGASYVQNVENRIKRLNQECSWVILADITPLSFERWRNSNPKSLRSKKPLSPKTLNEYLNDITAFCNWLLKMGILTKNSLQLIDKVETRGKESKKRRAWSTEELDKFLAVKPPTQFDYRMAVYLLRWTGLRKNELQKLRWSDVNLDSQTPHIIVRSETVKNKKTETLPLVDQAIKAFKVLSDVKSDKDVFVLSYKIPRAEQLQRDLKRANIVYHTVQGDLDFHSLRHTFGTWLSAEGMQPRMVQLMMRHSDANMTMNRYTDVNALPVAQSVRKLSQGGRDDCLLLEKKTNT